MPVHVHFQLVKNSQIGSCIQSLSNNYANDPSIFYMNVVESQHAIYVL